MIFHYIIKAQLIIAEIVEYFGTEMPVFKCSKKNIIKITVNKYIHILIQSVPAVLYKLFNRISTVVIYFNNYI